MRREESLKNEARDGRQSRYKMVEEKIMKTRERERETGKQKGRTRRRKRKRKTNKEKE